MADTSARASADQNRFSEPRSNRYHGRLCTDYRLHPLYGASERNRAARDQPAVALVGKWAAYRRAIRRPSRRGTLAFAARCTDRKGAAVEQKTPADLGLRRRLTPP